MSYLDEFEVVWHGAKVDAFGTKGGLLGPYHSISTWSLVEDALWRIGAGRPSNDESQPGSEPDASPLPPTDSRTTEDETPQT